MKAQDLLFGETFVQGESLHFNGRTGVITSWDWKGRPFRFHMVGSGSEHEKTVQRATSVSQGCKTAEDG